jgi:LCP family protein required for cell wall assembly
MDRADGQLGRTDGIVIGVFDYAHNRVGLISVPRDLYVDIPGIEQGRINTVYRVGARVLGRSKGLALLKAVIRSNLGIAIDYTAEVDFKGFIAAVDELGGITVDVKCPIEDCFWMGDETCVPLSLTAGEHHLDGRTALLFARSRHGRTDIDRGRRQQAVLVGLKNRLVRPSTLLHLPKLFEKMGQYIQTDLTPDAMLRMGSLLKSAGRENLHGLVMRAPVVEGRETEDGKSVLVLKKPEWNRAFATLFDAPPPGAKDKGVCPASDVGLNWRERKQKTEEKRKASRMLAAGN